jgi:hypothetical protein
MEAGLEQCKEPADKKTFFQLSVDGLKFVDSMVLVKLAGVVEESGPGSLRGQRGQNIWGA